MFLAMTEMAAAAKLSLAEATPTVFPGASKEADRLFTAGEAHELFQNSDIRCGEHSPGHHRMSLVQNEALVPVNRYGDSLENAQALQQEGATALFRLIQLYCARASEACREFANGTGLPIFANGYWTPAHAMGLPLLSSPVSYFLVQTTGTRNWVFFTPKAAHDNDEASINWVHEGASSLQAAPPATAAMHFTVTPGDVLVVPRGWGHYALPSTEESLHLCFAFFPEGTVPELVSQQYPVLPE